MRTSPRRPAEARARIAAAYALDAENAGVASESGSAVAEDEVERLGEMTKPVMIAMWST